MYSNAFILSLFNACNYKQYSLKTNEFLGIVTFILNMA